jgi:glutaredoxin
VYCHANWAARDLQGICLPLLADFHPKGAVAGLYGLYLEKAGITDRATVIIDKDGIVRHASSVTPSGHRKAEDLLALCVEIDRKHGFSGEAPPLERPARPGRLELYFHHECAFSRNVLSAIKNMRLEGAVDLHDVRSDPKEMEALVGLTGKQQVPCLVVDGKPMHESKDINRFLYQAFCC